jgi:hypothetical protein
MITHSTRLFLAVALLVSSSACNQSSVGPGGEVYGTITLKDVVAILSSNDSYTPSPDGPGAGVIVNQPVAEEAEATMPVSDSCVVLMRPEYRSERGLSPIKLMSSKQMLTATFDTDRYRIDGLVADAAFAAGSDSLSVAYEGDNPFTEMVPAPPPIVDPNAHLGERDGLATKVMMDDGAFDVVAVSISATDGVNPYELACTYLASDMTLSGGKRSTSLVDAEARGEVESMGLTPVNVIVSFDRQVMSDKYFPDGDPIALRAGRAMSMDAAVLTVPMPGMCSFPTVVPLDSSGMGKLCFPQGPNPDQCTVTSGMCPDFDTYFEFVLSGNARSVKLGTGLQVGTTTGGTVDQVQNRVTDIPDETDVTITAADFNSHTTTITFRFSGQMVTVSSLGVQ